MLNDLDKTLKVLLDRELPSLEASAIHFEAPDAEFRPSGLAIDLFLYDVRENHELRDNEWTIERNGGIGRMQPPPARVDCSYLITAWAGDIASEHLLLGQVMRALLRYPTLPVEILQGSLAAQELPPPTSALQPGTLQSMGEFWQAMGGRPRAALHYTVTIAVQTSTEAIEAPLVFEQVIAIRPDVRPAQGG